MTILLDQLKKGAMPKGDEKKKIDAISLQLTALQSELNLFKENFKEIDDAQAEFNDITNERFAGVTTYILKIRETLRQISDIMSTQKENMTPKNKRDLKKILTSGIVNSDVVLNTLNAGGMVHTEMYTDDQQFMEERYMDIERRIRP